MEIRPIRSEADLAAAESEIARLMEAGAEAGSPEGDRLEVLATLTEAYEREHHPIGMPDPISALWERIVSNDLPLATFYRICGGGEEACRILGRQEALTLPMVRQLSVASGLPVAVLAQAYPLLPVPEDVRAMLSELERRAA